MGHLFSNTVLVQQEITKFWDDCQPHSIQDFKVYLRQNNIEPFRDSHINSAIYTAQQDNVLERIGRGVYRAGMNFGGNAGDSSEKTNSMAYVLRKAQNALSIPINLIELDPKERELIPRLQELYQECRCLLNELERGRKDDEVSE